MRSRWVALLSLVTLVAVSAASIAGSSSSKDARCVDPGTGESVDCVPATYTTFDIPFAKLPGGRMDAHGNLDPTSSPEDAHAGAFVAAKRLGLFRNFEWVHWVPTAASKKDPATGKWCCGDPWPTRGAGRSGERSR